MRLETERLIIRPWEPRDREPYARFNADPVTRRFYLNVLTRMETDAAIDRYNISIAREGYGYLAVERKADGAFLGGVGMVPVGLKLRGDPKVEVGWLIGRDYWGQGYAPEAASALLDVAFGTLALPEIVAFTAVVNVPSQRVMQKIGMVRDPLGDFEHPKIPPEHPLRPHVLYRIANPRRAP